MYRLSPINQWLQDIHMEQYTEQFLSSGYFNLDHIANLDRLDLIGIGIENEDHITCILEAIPGRMGDKETKSTILSDFQFSEKDFSEIDIIGPCDEDSVSFWKVVEQHGIFSYNFGKFHTINIFKTFKITFSLRGHPSKLEESNLFFINNQYSLLPR